MEEEQVKVHDHRKHRQNNVFRVNVTEPASNTQ